MLVYLFTLTMHNSVSFSLLAWVLILECTHTHLHNVNLKESAHHQHIDPYFLPSRDLATDV